MNPRPWLRPFGEASDARLCRSNSWFNLRVHPFVWRKLGKQLVLLPVKVSQLVLSVQFRLVLLDGYAARRFQPGELLAE